MQKIHIKHFGPISEAEIILNQAVLLIGEQASGKSTTAKLVYFFRSLRRTMLDVIGESYKSVNRPQRIVDAFKQRVAQKFITYFGTIPHLTNFELEFYFSLEKAKKIQILASNEQIDILVSDTFSEQMETQQFRRLLADLKNYFASLNKKNEFMRESVRQNLNSFINELFEDQSNLLFYPAGRSVAVNYPEALKLAFFGSLASDLRAADLLQTQQNLSSESTIDVKIMQEFLQQSESLKDRFANHDLYSVNNTKLISTLQEEPFKLLAQEKITAILKGSYKQDAAGEKIYFSDEAHVLLRDASSGQQEVIRLLQDAYLIILDHENVFRIIEEPEAHLWPMAQKHLVELLALLLNQTHSQILITTHSPYILSVCNNLLYATRVAGLNGHVSDVSQVIDRQYWLDPNLFEIYFLSKGTCRSVMDKRLGLIDQNLLDEVSEVIGDEFDTLYSMNARVH